MLGVSMRVPESADLGGALHKYITSVYSPDEAAKAARGISDVQALRTRLVQSVTRNANEQDHASTLQAFLAYYKTLTCLVARFPFQSASRPLAPEPAPSGLLNRLSATMSTKKERQISFLSTWFDAFRHSNRVQDYDIAFERLSVLFDIAALYSRQATAIKSGLPSTGSDSTAQNSSLKEACRLFQLSSGIFEHLARSPEIVSGALGAGLSLDLSSDALSMLGVLMLAQAQACFFEAATTSASPKLVAKLAMGASTLFADAHARCQRNSRLQAITGKSDVYPWGQHCQYQAMCYRAAANFWYAKGVLADDDYGPEIAHLERAALLLSHARKAESGLLRNLADNRTRLENAINIRLAAALKDNNTIYFAAVPKSDSLSDPEHVAAVKSLAFLDTPGGITIEPAKDDPFTFLISPFLREQHDTLKARVAEVQTALGARVKTAEETAKKQLEALGLPAALDALTEGASGLPEDVWSRIKEIQYTGGAAQLQDLNSRIDSAVAEVQTAFQEVVAQLAKESDMDSKMRAQFSHRWNRRPSEQLTVHLQKDCDSIRRFLHDAEASNQKVRSELAACRDRFELLSLSREALEARLPRATAEQSQGSQESVRALRTLLAALSDNTQQLLRLQPDFEAKVNATDFMQQLMNSSVHHGASAPSAGGSGGAVAPDAGSNDALLTQALEPFQQFHHAYDSLISQQATLLSQISTANSAFISLRSLDDSTARRQAFLQELNVGVASFKRLLANLNEGCKFYSDLNVQKVSPLAQKVADFTIARNMESQLLLEQLSRSSSGFVDDSKSQSSVFPQAHAHAPSGAAGGGNPFADAGGYGGSAASAPSAGASNPNLYDRANLYQMNSPPPPKATSPLADVPGGANRPYGVVAPQQQPQQHAPYAHPPQQQHPQYQQPHQPAYSAPPHSYQPAPAQQARPAQMPEWTCAACTFLNPLSATACGMCGGKR